MSAKSFSTQRPQERFMFCVALLVVGLALSALWAGCATSEPTISKSNESESIPVIDPASVELTKPIHFSAPDGSDIVAPAGTYHVEKGEGSQLRLSPADGTAPLVIAALASEHEVEVIAPLALTIPIEEDSHHVVLIQPGGKALDAVGSASGVVTRGPLKPIPPGLLSQALSAQVSPAFAVLYMPKILLPADGAIALRSQVVVTIQLPQRGVMPYADIEFTWLDAATGSAPSIFTTDAGAVVQGFRPGQFLVPGHWQVRVRMIDNVDNRLLAKPGPWSLPTQFSVK